MQHKQEKRKDIGALVFSLAFHTLLLLAAYYWFIKTSPSQQAKAYRVQLSRPSSQEEVVTSNQTESFKNQSEQVPTEQPVATNKKSKVEAPTTELASEEIPVKEIPQEESSQPTPVETKISPSEQESEQKPIDERGLYTTDQDKQTGASLELIGWIWDNIPQAQDTTSETGKLVFEITIDDLGEIIAVKTLEKTVSPLVEQIYKDAIAKLTFSKTTENRTYAATSVGRVTFLIQAK
jgi:protein TonB